MEIAVEYYFPLHYFKISQEYSDFSAKIFNFLLHSGGLGLSNPLVLDYYLVPLRADSQILKKVRGKRKMQKKNAKIRKSQGTEAPHPYFSRIFNYSYFWSKLCNFMRTIPRNFRKIFLTSGGPPPKPSLLLLLYKNSFQKNCFFSYIFSIVFQNFNNFNAYF